VSSRADHERRAGTDRLAGVWLLFSVTWALAVLFHVAGNPRLAPAWGRGILGAAAVLTLARPRDPRAAVPLAVAVLVNVWLEAPVLANHWLLHGFIAVVVLGGAVRLRTSPGEVAARIAGPLRFTLLAFYAFAAFAKLNADFFDPSVSCAVLYLEESASSWGLRSLGDLTGVMGRSVAVVVAAVEVSVPVLLVLRRSRNVGVVVALAFHFVLAVDRSHQFFDFSSVLAVLFLLFLAPETVERLLEVATGMRDRIGRTWESGPEILLLVALAAAALVVVVASGPGDWPAPRLLREVGVWTWLLYGGALVVVVALVAMRRSPLGHLFTPGAGRALYVIPLVAAVNGTLPYLEVKSAASWNMYSNLAVVDGSSNHLVVRSGLPLTGGHERLVEIVDPGATDLAFYAGGPWLVPEPMLLDYLAEQDGTVVIGRVDGRTEEYRGGEGPVRPEWRQKFQVFRAVDPEAPVRCQPSFGPAA
jgi:hypothetical protein